MSNIGEIVYEDESYVVRGPMPLSSENIDRLWKQAKAFPHIFGKETLGDAKEFINMFVQFDGEIPIVNGLFYIVNDFQGAFYLTDIVPEEDALAHYTFFDKRHHGRETLVREMLKYVFKKYGFHRLSVQIPNYATSQARHFIQGCGFIYEGKKRKAARFKGDWFDVNLYSILRSEVLNG
jgi:RimJ/RimL family protein N-acetyltransferase